MRIILLLAAALMLTGASWIDPYGKAREAADLYEKGEFEAATQKYNEALTDDPDSYLLQYNRGASLYREDKFEDAAAAFARAPAPHPAETAYDVGNAKYRLGAATAESDPQKAIGLYAEALAAYRRAMGANPDDADAKFNHELVTKKLEALKKKLEEQKQQEQQQDQQQNQQQRDQQQQSDQQQSDQSQEQKQEQQQDQPEQASPEQQQKQEDARRQAEQHERQSEPQQASESRGQQPDQHAQHDQQQQQGESATSGERGEGEMSPREAQALLDAARDQEVRPEEVIERMQGAAVLEPSEDW
jgi:Ca-activated chloride channel family protein